MRRSVVVVYETCWSGDPRWEGALLFSSLAAAQRQAEHAYLRVAADGSGRDPLLAPGGGAGGLVWSRQEAGEARAYETWSLLDGGARTPVSISARPVHDGSELPATLTGWRSFSPPPDRGHHSRDRPAPCRRGAVQRALSPAAAPPHTAGAAVPHGGPGPAVSSVEELLARFRRHPDLSEAMYALCGFDLSCRDHGEVLTAASGAPVEGFAGDDVGGTYFLCGTDADQRAVVYASPEGEGGLIADSLGDALRIIIGLPGWQDCLRFSAGGSLTAMRAAAAYLENDLRRVEPQLTARRARLAGALSLDLPPVHLLLARLHDAVARTTPSYVLTAAQGYSYTSLFGTLTPSDNPGWRAS
ncbi:hypothetical protein [Streptomyces crystallinus]|uniref:Uncharacterized protein n=1 Tax=Streptomyces crystallinus TaxID=68191 RepID=A0ABP3RXC7_9ACTN